MSFVSNAVKSVMDWFTPDIPEPPKVETPATPQAVQERATDDIRIGSAADAQTGAVPLASSRATRSGSFLSNVEAQVADEELGLNV